MMGPRRDRLLTVLRAIVHEVRSERITFMAGSIAYNAFVSLLPLLVLLLTVLSLVGRTRLETDLIGMVGAAVTPGAAGVLVDELQHTSTGASLLGVAVLVWGVLRIFRSLDAAFSDIYETEAENTLADQFVDGIVVFGSMAAVILLTVVIESRLAFGTGSGGWWLLHRVLLVGVVGLALVPMYYLFPDVPDMGIGEILPGVLVAATALVSFESLFSLYVAYRGGAQQGILESILLFMTWLYGSGLVVLVGAAINAVLSNRSDDVDIRPVVGGVQPSQADQGDRPRGAIPVATLSELGHRLSTATDVTVVVDGTSIELPPPERVDTDADTTRLPFVNETVSIELVWQRTDDED